MTEKQYTHRAVYTDYLLLVVGAGLMACATKCIFDANHLAVGGFSGLAIILRAISSNWISGGIPLWLTNSLLNIPLFATGWYIKGREFIRRTLVATAAVSFWLYLLPQVNLIKGDLILVSLFGGVLEGVGIGMIFLCRATTGGTDMIGALIQHYHRHLSVPWLMGIADGLVILLGAFVFGVNQALYAVLVVVVVSKVADTIVEGMHFAKSVYIISEENEQISKEIMKRFQRGTTLIYARGMYSNEQRNILYCVVQKKELTKLKEIVYGMDQKAFLIVSDAKEVLGEGFLPLEEKVL